MKQLAIINKVIVLICIIFISACSSEDSPLSVHIHLEKAKYEQEIEVDGQIAETNESGKVAEVNKEEEVTVVVKRSFPKMFGKNSKETERNEPILKSEKATTEVLAIESEPLKELVPQRRLMENFITSGTPQAANNTDTEETEPLVEIDDLESKKKTMEVSSTQEQSSSELKPSSNQAKASVKVAGQVMASAWFEVDWQGPRNSADYLIIISADGKSRFDQRFVGGSDKALSKMLAPGQPGEYLMNYESGGVVYASTKLKVVKAIATIKTPSNPITVGSQFNVQWTGPKNNLDRLAIFSMNGKKEYDNEYIYEENNVSPASLKAPEKAGEYEIRYLSNSGSTSARDTFEVVEAQASITPPSKPITEGSQFNVQWTGPKNNLDRLAIFSMNGKKKYDVEYIYQEGKVSPASLKAPEKAGEYEIRYSTNKGNTFARNTFKVVKAQASITPPSEPVTAGSQFNVQWAGPKNSLDRIAIFSMNGKKKYDVEYIYQEDKVSPASLKAPEKAGEYEIRYSTNKGNTFARDTFKVVKAQATIIPTSQPITAGSQFNVQWTGPKNNLDRIAIYSMDGKKEYDKEYIYQEGKVSPASLKAPEKAGEYEIRYSTNKGNTFARGTFKVKN